MPHIDQQRDMEPQRLQVATPADWRRGQLVAAGFPRGLAARLARDPRYDLHALVELAERGCPPELAVRILAPLDRGAGAAA
jgi:hypothetical protein